MAVIGAEVADRLGIAAGDSLLSSPETVFDLAGVYPLKMRIVGVMPALFEWSAKMIRRSTPGYQAKSDVVNPV